LKDNRGRKITEEKGKKEGEEGEARKNNVYKKAIGLVFWNVAGVKRQGLLGLFRKVRCNRTV